MITKLEDGKYIIKVTALHVEKEKLSAMSQYLGEVAILTKDTHNLTITLMLTDNEIITGFQLVDKNNQKIIAKETQTNIESNSHYQLFELEDLPYFLKASVQYKIEHEGRIINGDEMLRLKLDFDHLEKVE